MRDKLQADLARCHREIERASAEVMKAVDPGGALLGLQDWNWERRIIEDEIAQLANVA